MGKSIYLTVARRAHIAQPRRPVEGRDLLPISSTGFWRSEVARRSKQTYNESGSMTGSPEFKETEVLEKEYRLLLYSVTYTAACPSLHTTSILQRCSIKGSR